MSVKGPRALVGPVLWMLALLLAVRMGSIAWYEPANLTRPAYILLGLFMPHPPGGAPEPSEATPDWRAALAGADLVAGSKASEQCRGCHDLSSTNQNRVGPGLHDVLDRRIASRTGFEYSGALAAHAGHWTPDELFRFLRDPQLAVPWTKMSFAGIKDAQQRINLIAFLRANAASAPAASQAAQTGTPP